MEIPLSAWFLVGFVIGYFGVFFWYRVIKSRVDRRREARERKALPFLNNF